MDWADKAEARAFARSRLTAMDDRAREDLSAIACAEAFDVAVSMGARLALLFLSMRREIDTATFIDAAFYAGLPMAVPRIIGDEIEFVELPPDWPSWPRDGLGIPEPPESAKTVPDTVISSVPTVALIPGLLFDKRGSRLGRGKGYYDRFLARLPEPKIAIAGGGFPYFLKAGFCFSFQLVSGVPSGDHDGKMDAVITEKGLVSREI